MDNTTTSRPTASMYSAQESALTLAGADRGVGAAVILTDGTVATAKFTELDAYGRRRYAVTSKSAFSGRTRRDLGFTAAMLTIVD